MVFVIIDYVTEVMCVVVDRKYSGAVGIKGIYRKILIFMLVGIANILGMQVINTGSILRTVVILFYLNNEGLSILENVGYLGLPIPERLKLILGQLHNKSEGMDDK